LHASWVPLLETPWAYRSSELQLGCSLSERQLGCSFSELMLWDDDPGQGPMRAHRLQHRTREGPMWVHRTLACLSLNFPSDWRLSSLTPHRYKLQRSEDLLAWICYHSKYDPLSPLQLTFPS
jgi:hypothetical protein